MLFGSGRVAMVERLMERDSGLQSGETHCVPYVISKCLAGPASLCCPLSLGPAQNRSYDAAWFLLFAGGVGTAFSFELVHAATSVDSFLEAFPQVITKAAVLLWLDDTILISGHTVFRNAKARRPAVRHILHSKGRESIYQAN
jgi:hypothetical protein